MRTHLALLLSIAAFSGLRAQTFHVIARNTADSVVLRWAPSSAAAWQEHNLHGYRVERVEIARSATPVPKDPRPVGPARIGPWTLDEFGARFPGDDPRAGAVAQLLHGEAMAPQAGATDPMGMAQAADELTMRWSFCLLMADLDARMADALGLRVADRDVKADAIYLYRVIALHPERPDTALVGVDRALGAQRAPDGPHVLADEQEMRVTLSWEPPLDGEGFSGYWVERSADGRAWSRLNQRPFVPTTPDGGARPLMDYADTTLTSNYQPHHYRVLGITPFGEVSPSAPAIVAMGRDRTPPPSPGMKGVTEENGRLVVHWEQSESVPDLKGYRVEKAATALGGHVPLHAGLLPPSARRFTDTSHFQIAENHYRVAAVDTAGNVSWSPGGYGSLSDTLPPAPPTGLTGEIDTNGVVTVRWRLGREPDLLGYRVFFANAPDHEFNNLTPAPMADTLFRDTLQLRTLTRRIHYRVVAVDRHFNHSAMSAMLTLTRPDLVPPVAPVLKDYQVSDTAVTLHFIPSSSTDVARHRLLRKGPGDDDWREAATIPASDQRRTWTDRAVSGPAFYRYTLVAVDSSGNASLQAVPVDVRVHGRTKAPAVRNVRAVHADARMVQVNWDQPTETVRHYVIHRAKDGGVPVSVGSAKGGDTTWTDVRLSGMGRYTYTVTAVYADGVGSEAGRGAEVEVR